MKISFAFWRHSTGASRASMKVVKPPDPSTVARKLLLVALWVLLLGTVAAPLTVAAQNLGASPQFGQAVQGETATTVGGTVLNVVNWGCNVIAPVIAVACLGVAVWHFRSGRGYLGWGVTGVGLMLISGLGRMAEGFITQAQGIQ